ncbi:MAG: sigma-54-dependent Fis family transcriptional regulator, partial [Planctomycetes bacterium]|nr:sigma-54-dependent Fis family transcriptional regulator [Planctomycetota bacterium]
MRNEKIVVIDDDAHILEVIQMRLRAWGYSVFIARNGKEALAALSADSFNLAIVDLRLEDESGLGLMEELIRHSPNLPIIILTAHGSIESAVEAMKRGAYSYLTKPFNSEDLLLHIKNALEKQRLTEEVEQLRRQLNKRQKCKPIIGKSPQIQEILGKISRISQTDSIVAIYGESGTGKNLVAMTIHHNSPRSNAPFIAVNCSDMSEGLLENELFGQAKSASKNAGKPKDGLFKQADGGTLFLDGIDSISLSLQIKLLDVLQENEFKQIGGTKNIKVNVRFIFSADTGLQESVNNGTFRKDLFYKIHVAPIYLPPIRERRDDIPLLSTYFLTEFCAALKKNIIGFTPAAIQRMVLYDWPGNIRELQNKIEHAVIMTNKDIITTEDIFTDTNVLKNAFNSYKDAKERFEREYLENLLKICKGNITSVSKMA